MKYSPKVNEELIRSPKVADLHPAQDDETVQGILEIMHRFERMLCEISGMDRFTFQPGGGSQGVYANARMIRAYHEARGEGHRDEIVTTIFSHPCDAAGPATAGFRIVTLYPGPKGYPELDAVKAAVSERTAGLMITNPEDTGIFNPEIDEFVDARPRRGRPLPLRPGERQRHPRDHAGPRRGLRPLPVQPAQDVLLAALLDGDAVRRLRDQGRPGAVPAGPDDRGRGRALPLDYDRPQSVGTIRAFHGVPATVVRSYAWVLALSSSSGRPASRNAPRTMSPEIPEKQSKYSIRDI